jgi:hypothetical protein
MRQAQKSMMEYHQKSPSFSCSFTNIGEYYIKIDCIRLLQVYCHHPINLSASLLKMRPNRGTMRANFITMRPSLLDTQVAR